MAKVVFAPIELGPATALRRKRVRGADGDVATLQSVDAESESFLADLTGAFRNNVAKARRDNAALNGAHAKFPKK